MQEIIKSELTVPNINTVFEGQNSISYFWSIISNLVPAELRKINSFRSFKSKIKACRPENCPFAKFTQKTHNLGQNICRLFHFLAQFVFITTETELDYYHQKVNERVASRVGFRTT